MEWPLGFYFFFYFWNGAVINPMDQRVIVDSSIPIPRGRTLAHSWGKHQNPCVQVARVTGHLSQCRRQLTPRGPKSTKQSNKQNRMLAHGQFESGDES